MKVARLWKSLPEPVINAPSPNTIVKKQIGLTLETTGNAQSTAQPGDLGISRNQNQNTKQESDDDDQWALCQKTFIILK